MFIHALDMHTSKKINYILLEADYKLFGFINLNQPYSRMCWEIMTVDWHELISTL